MAVISFRSLTRRSLDRACGMTRPRDCARLLATLVRCRCMECGHGADVDRRADRGAEVAARLGAALTDGARGDDAALAAMYERHHQALYRYCRSILHDDEDARDALQSTMAKALAALRDEERDFELRPWLFRIAHNEAISRLRQRRESRWTSMRSGRLGTIRWRRRWRTASAWRCCAPTCATCPSASARRSSCAS